MDIIKLERIVHELLSGEDWSDEVMGPAIAGVTYKTAVGDSQALAYLEQTNAKYAEDRHFVLKGTFYVEGKDVLKHYPFIILRTDDIETISEKVRAFSLRVNGIIMQREEVKLLFPENDAKLASKANASMYARMQEVYSVLLVETPSIDMISAYENDVSEELQTFCVNNLRPAIKWSTGIGIIDAARCIYTEAVANANIEANEFSFFNL